MIQIKPDHPMVPTLLRAPRTVSNLFLSTIKDLMVQLIEMSLEMWKWHGPPNAIPARKGEMRTLHWISIASAPANAPYGFLSSRLHA